MKNQKGITLISLVITIVVLIILAGVAINMTLGENGIFTKAQEAKKMQAIATAKEQIGLEILEAQIEAMENNEELEQSQVEAIVAKYGELQEDGDTIILNDTEYEVSLREIYNEMAEEEGDETTELAQLKALLSQTTVTEDKILKDYKAYKDGRLITGTMEDYAGQTQDATATSDEDYTYISIPNNGYYTTESKLRMENNNSGGAIEIYHPQVTQGNSTLSIPEEYKNGTLFLIDTYDQRSHNAPSITGKTANFTSTNVFGHSYVNVILMAYDLENDSSVDIQWTKSNNNNAIDAFIIKDDANIEYLASSINNSNPISVAKGEKYIYCGVCDYRQILAISSPSCLFGSVKTKFSTSTDVSMQIYYCVYFNIIEALEDGTFSAGASANQVGLYFKM